MAATDVLIVFAVMLSLVTALSMGWFAQKLLHSLQDVHEELTEIRQLGEATALVLQEVTHASNTLSTSALAASDQVAHLDDLISTASSVTGTVDTATQATFRVLTNPLIKTAAFVKGTRRAAGKLRGTDQTALHETVADDHVIDVTTSRFPRRKRRV